MSAMPLPQEVVSALATRDTALAAMRARAREAEARAAWAESMLSEARAELVVLLRRLRIAEAAKAKQLRESRAEETTEATAGPHRRAIWRLIRRRKA